MSDKNDDLSHIAGGTSGEFNRMKVSDRIRNRLIEAEKPFFANDSIADHIKEGELEEMKKEVASHVRAMMHSLVIDVENDHNTKETAERVAKMYIEEVMMGRYYKKPKLTMFPNAKKLDEIIVVGPIEVRSMCSHHLVPIIGQVWVGVIPGNKLIGLSKYNRLAHWIMSRPQIQEEACIQLVDEIEKELEAMGVILIMRAEHMCMKWRGVKDDSIMGNSIVRGIFKANPHAKQEFLEVIKGMGYGR